MAKQTSTGITLGVVDETPATNDAAGFGALTFEAVGEGIDIPEYGPNVQVVESQPLATGVTEKFNGLINYGSMASGRELGTEHDGQPVLEAAVPAPAAHCTTPSFEIAYPDGTVEYFTGGIFSYTRTPGSANTMVGSTVNVEITSAIVLVLT